VDVLGDARETDFVFLRDELGPEELDYLERARTFVRDEVLPVIADYWERAEFPWDLARRLGELGLIGDANIVAADDPAGGRAMDPAAAR